MNGLGVIQGKTFLITGAASGLGAGYAELFLKDGAKSVAILDVAEETGKATVEKLNKSYPGQAIFVKCNVASEESITEAFNEVVDKFKTVDVVINNAGIMNDSPSIWRTATDVNYQGVISLTLKGLNHMRTDEGGKGGTIINVSSCLAILRSPYLPIYSGSKAAVLSFSFNISRDPFHQRTGVRILTICYGATDTPLLHNLRERSYDDAAGHELATSFAPGYVQKAESAVKGLVDMFKQGANGTVWIAMDDMPVEDITETINKSYDLIQKALFPNL